MKIKIACINLYKIWKNIEVFDLYLLPTIQIHHDSTFDNTDYFHISFLWFMFEINLYFQK